METANEPDDPVEALKDKIIEAETALRLYQDEYRGLTGKNFCGVK